MDTMTDDFHLLTGAYAVDALEADERARFERHLAGCDDCQLEVASFRDATTALAVASTTPAPPGMRSAVLNEVDRTRQVSPLTATPSAGRTRQASWLAAAAAAVVAVGLAGLLIRAQGRIDDLEQTSELALAPDAESVVLAGSPDTELRLTWSDQLGRGVLVGGRVADPGPGSDYQLWIVADGEPRSLGVFEPDGGRVELGIGDLPAPGDIVAITIEPDGGSPAPTTEPGLSATVL